MRLSDRLTPTAKTLFVLAAFVVGLPATSAPVDSEEDPLRPPTGNLTADLLYSPSARERIVPRQDLLSIVARPRSVPLAAAMSAALPGLGQAYNRSWIRAGVAIGIEAALLSGYFVWRAQGRDGEREFMAYAHRHWSPLRYAEWLSGYTGYGGPPIEAPALGEEDFRDPDSWTDVQRQEVRSFFGRIRAAEEQSYHLETNAVFSHVLPYFGEQQYYELIGKYFQFAPGWDDYNGANDPEQSASDGTKVNVPRDSRFFAYDAMHEDANNRLRRASRVSGLIIVNHFAAAIDAAITAKLHNDRIKAKVVWYPTVDGDVATRATMSIRF